MEFLRQTVSGVQSYFNTYSPNLSKVSTMMDYFPLVESIVISEEGRLVGIISKEILNPDCLVFILFNHFKHWYIASFLNTSSIQLLGFIDQNEIALIEDERITFYDTSNQSKKHYSIPINRENSKTKCSYLLGNYALIDCKIYNLKLRKLVVDLSVAFSSYGIIEFEFMNSTREPSIWVLENTTEIIRRQESTFRTRSDFYFLTKRLAFSNSAVSLDKRDFLCFVKLNTKNRRKTPHIAIIRSEHQRHIFGISEKIVYYFQVYHSAGSFRMYNFWKLENPIIDRNTLDCKERNTWVYFEHEQLLILANFFQMNQYSDCIHIQLYQLIAMNESKEKVIKLEFNTTFGRNVKVVYVSQELTSSTVLLMLQLEPDSFEWIVPCWIDLSEHIQEF